MNCLNKIPKNGYGFIYKYTSPSNKSYIGQTTYSLKERYNYGRGYKNCPLFYNAIKKYGFENFQSEILEECLLEELDSREQYWIETYHTKAPNGYNIQKGGPNLNYSSRKNKKREIKKYDLNGNLIKQYESLIVAARDNQTSYQQISDCVLHKIKYHNGFIYQYAEENPPNPVIRDVRETGRKTGQYDLNDNLIQIFESASKAAQAIGKNAAAGRNIRSVCTGKRQTAYGYKWKYLE